MGSSVLSCILVGLSLVYCSFGEAADWEFMGKSQDGKVSAFIDRESIRPLSENLKRASVKLEYYGVQPARARKTVSHAIGNEEVDCSQRRTTTRQFTLYFTDGDTLPGQSSNWKFVIPESSMQSMYDHVCSDGKK